MPCLGSGGDREQHVRETIIGVMNVRSADTAEVTRPRPSVFDTSAGDGPKKQSSGRDGSENCRYVLKQAEDEDVQQRRTEENNKQRD